MALLQEPGLHISKLPPSYPQEVPPEPAAGGEERRPLAVEPQEEVEDGHWALAQPVPLRTPNMEKLTED